MSPPDRRSTGDLTAAASGRCLVMGVVNVTPDSFSDGGEWFEPDAAIAHGLDLLAEGADLLDVGGESTRPGASRVPEDEERRRVLPVVQTLADAGATVSIDTMRASVAEAALAAGAAMVNDVSGGLADPALPSLVAEAGVPYVAMHWRGHSDRMDDLAQYDDVVADVAAELAQRADALLAVGISSDRLVLDPGLGFAKTGDHNWRLLGHLDAITALGFPVLVGASRKRFLGHLLAGADGKPASASDRDRATAATSALAAAAGAWCVRVHDVASSADAVRVAAAWTEQSDPRPVQPGPRSDTTKGFTQQSDARPAQAGPRSDVAEGEDRIELIGLRATGHHGVFEFERRDGQEFVVDVVLHVDVRAAAASDHLSHTVHYGELAERVHAVITGEPVDLIETLAERVAEVCLRPPGVKAVDVAVHKPQAPVTVAFGDVVVRVHRRRPGARP